MVNYLKLSTEIYDTKSIKQYRRMIVFALRAWLHNKKMQGLIKYFQTNAALAAIYNNYPWFIEQATRQFFYYNSKFTERIKLIQQHFCFLQKKITRKGLLRVYGLQGVTLWSQQHKESILALKLHFEAGQKKEGLLSVKLCQNSAIIYQIIFWLAFDMENVAALYIGALQGMQNGSGIIHDLTKLFYGYRTKNLILYALRAVAESLGIERIYAVSNHGFYANNHIRLDRKLKTSLDEFWEETGGKLGVDSRFFEVPVLEPRKSIEEVVSHKRNQYRKRFAALDGMSEEIKRNMADICRKDA